MTADSPRKPKKPGPRKPKGRPPGWTKATLNIAELEKLAGMQCTYEDAASWLGVTKVTFIEYMKRPEVREAWERGQGKGKVSLRRLQWEQAQKGNTTMLIFLGKNILRQRDRFDDEEEGNPAQDMARRIKGALDAIDDAVVDPTPEEGGKPDDAPTDDPIEEPTDD